MRVSVLRAGKAAAASGILAALGQGALGCAVETGGDEAVVQDDTALAPGAATLLLSDGAADITMSQSTSDEFVRVGEQLTLVMPAWYLWLLLYPNDPVPNDVARLMALTPALTVQAFDKTTMIGQKALTTSWNATPDAFSLQATTNTFGVPFKTDTLKMLLTITDAQNAAASVMLDVSQMPQVHVFGGEPPAKSLLFDNNGNTKRQRVIEGDQVGSAAPLLFGVSDWRTEQIVDRFTIDTQIGVALGQGRFGPYEFPIYGSVQYEVGYGVYFNDAQGWRPEALLAQNPASVMLPLGATGRTMYEEVMQVPAKATQMSIYLHVKAFLYADYSGYNVTQQWYAQGSSTLVRDSYDNPNGAFSNYDFNLQH